MIIISACLAGINCKWNGKNNLNKAIAQLVKDGKAIAACPEMLAGLSIPRDPAEIISGDGFDVLKNQAKVFTRRGKDVTEQFIAGAKKTLGIIKKKRIKDAILKSNSPSCGYKFIYDGTFSKHLKRGIGVTAALLSLNKVNISTEKDFFKK